MKSMLTDITVQLHQETPRAILVSDDGDSEKAVWLPKSQVEFDPRERPSINWPLVAAIVIGLVGLAFCGAVS